MMRCFYCSWQHLFLSHVGLPTCIIGPVDPCVAVWGKQDNLSDALDWKLKKKKKKIVPPCLPYNAFSVDITALSGYYGIERKILLCPATLCNSL
ncbi:hypothetical protein V8C35DRAFT_299564, partial [Trichoderma chlorosporum]